MEPQRSASCDRITVDMSEYRELLAQWAKYRDALKTIVAMDKRDRAYGPVAYVAQEALNA